MVSPELTEPIAKDICERWDAAAPELYEPEDVERGFIDVTDRRNELHQFPIMTVSLGISTNALRPIESHQHAAQVATEMAEFAKQDKGSSFAVDRRRI
jgi:hypothetical protein